MSKLPSTDLNTDSTLPSADFNIDLEPGSIKRVKLNNRRCDAVSFIPIKDIIVLPGFNPRIRDREQYLQHVRSIADSMKAEGFRIDQPLLGYVRTNAEGRDEVIVNDGHTRREAIDLANSEGANIEEAPVIFLARGTNIVDMTVNLVRSNSGQQLTVYETSIVVKRLAGMGLEDSEIAARLHFTPRTIENLHLLSSALPPLVKLIAREVVSATTATDAIRIHGPAKAGALLAEAVQRAESAGKTKVTPSQLPGAKYAKAVRASAPKFIERAQAIRLDPGFAQLSAENREALEQLLDALPEQEKDAKNDGAGEA